jgi:L-rhamnose mutarotase
VNVIMQRLYFALDLKNDSALIAEYESWHRPGRIWREILDALAAAGVEDLEIFRCGDRMIMVMDVPDDFSAADLAGRGSANQCVRDWEELMWKFQRPLPFAGVGEKWVPMKRMFSLKETLLAREGGE